MEKAGANLIEIGIPFSDPIADGPIIQAAFTAALAKGLNLTDIFETIRKGDQLLHRPYQSFQPATDFIQQAARDPRVVAIKQTVYRTGTDSVIISASAIVAASEGAKAAVAINTALQAEDETAHNERRLS